MRLGLGRVMGLVLLIERRSEGAAFSIGCRLLDPPIKSGDDGSVLGTTKATSPVGRVVGGQAGRAGFARRRFGFRFGKGTRPAQTVIHQHPAASGRKGGAF